jgi:hypothetical protein
MRTTFLTLLTLTLLTTASHAQTAPEKTLLDLANQSRAEHHLPPLTWDPALARAARAHIAVIAQHGGEAEHQYPGEPDLTTRGANAGAHFSTIAENVAGSGQSPAAIHEAWMNSPHHRANLLNPQLTAIGIAVIGTPGALYAVEDFGRASNPDAASAEQQVQQLLISELIQPDPSDQHKQEALANCVSGATPTITPGQPPPRLIMQWESGDLTKLPPELLQRIPHPHNPAKPQVAAVASCAPQKLQPGFTTYRIAVLIY